MKSDFSIFFLLVVLMFFYSCEGVNNPEEEKTSAGVNKISATINGKDTVLAISRVILSDYPATSSKPAHQQLTLITMGTRPGFSIDFYINDSEKLQINKKYIVGGGFGNTMGYTTVYLRKSDTEYGYPSVHTAMPNEELYYSKITELSEKEVKGFLKFNINGNFDFEGTFHANNIE